MTDTLPKATTEAVGIETPLCAPWRIVETEVAISIIDKDGDEVAMADHGDQGFWRPIVRAVNAHADLVKALEDIVGWRPDERTTVNPTNALDEFAKVNATLCSILDIAERALSKAKGG